MTCNNRSDNIKNNFPDILKKYRGIVTPACQEAGIARQTYYRWRQENEEFALLCDEAYEEAGDFVESKLYDNIEENDTTAIIFYCKTRLKKRGYVERIETTGKDGDPLKSEIEFKVDESTIVERFLAKEFQKRQNEEQAQSD
jgi:hypothetical protein